MEALKNKIDFVALVTVEMANGNGDPLYGNRPRIDYNGYGEISDVCIKRKIRNRFQDMGERVFVQSEGRCDDGYDSLKSRAEACIGKAKTSKKNDGMNRKEYAEKACLEFIDVRTFGQVFAFKDSKKEDDEDGAGVSIGVRGPVTIHQAVSVTPVEILSMQITKSVNGEPSETFSSDRMGVKHMVRFGLYKIKGSINVQLAQTTGFSHADAELLKECLRTLFENDASSARPEGSMNVYKLYWWEHNCKSGQYPTYQVHDSIEIRLKDVSSTPTSVNDYEITIKELPGLSCEIYQG